MSSEREGITQIINLNNVIKCVIGQNKLKKNTQIFMIKILDLTKYLILIEFKRIITEKHNMKRATNFIVYIICTYNISLK